MSPSRADRSAALARRLNTVASGSVVVAGVRRLVRSLTARRRTPVHDREVEAVDQTIVHVAGSSLAVRALIWPAEILFRAWPSSRGARAARDWLAIPLDRRVRFGAIAVASAGVTHIALTGFSAPEPTFVARATWVVLLAMLGAIAAGARGIAAAWQEWRRRAAAPRKSGIA